MPYIWALEPSLVVGFRSAAYGRALFGQLHTRQAISGDACDCCAPICSVLLEDLKAKCYVGASLAIVLYGFFAAATPILCYIIFNWDHYTSYEGLGTFIVSGKRCGDPVP